MSSYAGTFTKSLRLAKDLASAVHDFSTDTFKLVLSANVSPDATSLSDLVEVAETDDYRTGGVEVAVSRIARSTDGAGNRVRIWLATTAIYARSQEIGPFRYAVIVNATATNVPIVGWYDQGVSRSVPVGQGVTIAFDQIEGALAVKG